MTTARSKLTLAAVGVLVLSLAGFGVWFAARGETPPAPPAVEEKPAGPGTLLLVREGDFQMLTPEGKEVPARRLAEKDPSAFQWTLAPDGKAVAVTLLVEAEQRKLDGFRKDPARHRYRVAVHAPDAVKPTRTWDITAAMIQLAWAADGKSVVATKWLSHAPLKTENLRLDLATGKSETLDLPGDALVLDCARDGKTFVVAWPVTGKNYHYHLGLVAVGEKEPRKLTEMELFWSVVPIVGRLSPDESAVLFLDSDPTRPDAYRWKHSFRPFLIDVKSRKRTTVEGMPETGRAYGAAWSPDGKRVAYTSWNIPADILKQEHQVFDHRRETESVLIVADADGRNAKVVASQKGPYAKGSSAQSPMFRTIDWR